MYSEQRISRVMTKIVKRRERRVDCIIASSPLFANASINFDWTTPLENELLHFCRQYLMIHHPSMQPHEAKKKNMRVIQLAEKLGITRSEARYLIGNGTKLIY